MATPALTPAEKAYALAHTPAMPPPRPDIVPNFVDPYSLAYLITITTVNTMTITILFVLMRTYTKWFLNKKGMGWEDCKSSPPCHVVHEPSFVNYSIDLAILAWVSGFNCTEPLS